MRGTDGGYPLRGHTLVELMVVIVLLGMLAGVVSLSLGSSRPALTDREATLGHMRDSAARSGRPVTAVILDNDSVAHLATALPDGRLLTDYRATR